VERQAQLLDAGKAVQQETLGWDEASQTTHSQRSKEEAHDYRYFPEPDLPPLVVELEWVEKVHAGLPELPRAKAKRFCQAYDLAPVEAMLLVSERETAIFFEETVRHLHTVPARTAYAWLTGEVFAWMRQTGEPFTALKITPVMLAGLLESVQGGMINQNTGKTVLAEMLQSGQPAEEIIQRNGLAQVSDSEFISSLIRKVLMEHPDELLSYRSGKISLANWFFGQVMKAAGARRTRLCCVKSLKTTANLPPRI